MRRSMFIGFWAITAFLASLGAWASGGRTEFSQASIEADGGFPVTISAPGNFILTGSLTVPAGTDAFRLAASGVTFDLNGFTIAGPANCIPGSCPNGSGSAFQGVQSVANGRQITLINGNVQGFANDCIRLSSQARVDGLLVTKCGGTGIVAADGSMVTNNRVLQTGAHGIDLVGSSHPPTFANNTVASAGLRGGETFYGIQGGRASAGSSCDDGSCSPTGKRRFYVSSTALSGFNAAEACDPGFHIPHMMEIMNPSELYYLEARGQSFSRVTVGWVVSTFSCSNYTSTNGNGFLARFEVPIDSNQVGWDTAWHPCDGYSFPSFCIED
ncbi:MAG: right-handed parallel beta-helix repeat-containing protein [Myxococcota bacterium]